MFVTGYLVAITAYNKGVKLLPSVAGTSLTLGPLHYRYA